MSVPEAITVSIRDGQPYVDAPWPAYTLVHPDLIAHADPAILRLEGDTLHIVVTNGRATYRRGQDHGGALGFNIIRGTFAP